MLSRQAGVALITALLVVALAVVVTVALASQQKIAIRRSANLLGRDQAYLYALGGEAWASAILMKDQRQNQIDALDEEWAQRLPPIPVPGGSVRGEIEDLQGRFNLNALLREGKADLLTVQRFERLLTILGVDITLAERVVARLTPNGQEGSLAGGGSAAPGTPFLLVSASELRQLPGVTPMAWQRMAPFLTALPEATTINVNTAPVEILMSLAPEIGHYEAETLVAQRRDEAFKSVVDFLRASPLVGKVVDERGLAVNSRFFLVHVQARVGNGRVALFSLLARREQGITLLMRGQGPL